MKPKLTASATDNDLVALLGACSIFLALIEHMIPKPLPFLRIGLANLPILIALGTLNPRRLSLVVLLKILGQGLINGTLFSYVFLFSAAGSVASAVVMFAVSRLPDRVVSLVGVSISGGLASTMAQLALAFLLVFGKGTLYIAPVFLTISLITSVVLGLIASSFCLRSRWYGRVAGPEGRWR